MIPFRRSITRMMPAVHDSSDPTAGASGARRWLAAARDRVREYFSLARARQASAALTPSARAAVQLHAQAACSRWHVARNLTDPSHRPAALALYRQAVPLLVQACLIARGDEPAAPAGSLGRLGAIWQAHGILPPPALARVEALLDSTDPLAPDRLPPAEASDRADDFDSTCRFVAGLLELRSPREIAISRVLRRTAAAAGALALVIAAGIALFSPTNVARGKPVSASSVALNTTPAAAVDGSKSGLFGFHSGLENAPWLAIDLGARHFIDRIKVYGRGDAYNSQSIPLALEVSNDGAVYGPVGLRVEPFSATVPWILTFKPTPLEARFVRLRSQHRTYLVLGEVEIYGHPSR
jgi:hypothetical protein